MPNIVNRNTFRLICALALLAPNMALADACGDEIARLQARLDSSRARSSVLPDLPESNFATMHRQPTQASVASAKAEAEGKAESTLDQAKKLHAEGKEQECLRTLKLFDMP
jgi:hypothetical protein